MNVLVTGGAGYVGSHAAKALARAGHLPVVLDDLSRGHRDNVRWGPFIQARCGDPRAVREAIERHQIDTVLHFAAFAYVGESTTHPLLYFENNVVQTYHLLAETLRCGVRRFVLSSSCSTYGNPLYTPIPETHPQNPLSPYGESKLAVEKLVASLGKASGLQWVVLRYFNAAGADPEGELGEDHEPEPHLIPRAILAAESGQPLDIFGADYPTADGTALRDYVHVTDLADAHVRAAGYLRSGGRSMAMNLGSGSGYTVRQVVSAVETAVGKPVTVRIAPRREGDAPALIADPSLARRTLGWNCQYSDLLSIIETARRWLTRKRST